MKRIKLGSLWQPTLTAMQETDKSKLGLVVEGGGVRAIYAAGVLDVLLSQSEFPVPYGCWVL